MGCKNPGYDYRCSKGYKIDVKGATLRKRSHDWVFDIARNTIADYFVCIGFDDRLNMNPLKAWLIPGKEINHQPKLGITPTEKSLDRWKRFERPIDNIVGQCNLLKHSDHPHATDVPVRKEKTCSVCAILGKQTVLHLDESPYCSQHNDEYRQNLVSQGIVNPTLVPISSSGGWRTGRKAEDFVYNKLGIPEDKISRNNPGYDFIDDLGRKVDIKGATLRVNGKAWIFFLHKQVPPDYYIFVGYESLSSINPSHVWVIPGNLVKGHSGFAICTGSAGRAKWKEFEQDPNNLTLLEASK